MAGWKREMQEGEGKWTMLDGKCKKEKGNGQCWMGNARR
jgi:hypothetical protein